MDTIKNLQKLGLNKKEAHVYLAGLELGMASASEISKKSKVNRSNVYEILQKLSDSGMFTQTYKKSKKYFLPTHPREFKESYIKTLAQVTSDLENISNLAERKPKIYFYDNVAEIQKAYEKIIDSENRHTVGFAFDDISKMLGEEWLETYMQKRKDRHLRTETIATGFAASEKWKSKDARDDRFTKILSKEDFDLDTNIEIFGEKVFITSLKGETMGLVIESKKIADTMRKIFESLWERLR